MLDLEGEVSNKRGGSVGGGIVAKVDVVGVGSGICLIQEFSDGAKTLCFEAKEGLEDVGFILQKFRIRGLLVT